MENKQVTIFGASGRSGLELVKQSLHKGYRVKAYVRREGAIAFTHPNLNVVTGSLSDSYKLKEAMTGSVAILSALGGNSLTKHTVEITEGMRVVVKVAEELGIERFIYISSFGVGDSRYYMPWPVRFLVADLFLRIPLADHKTNETILSESTLNWTVLRPGGLTDGSISKTIIHGSNKTVLRGNPKISRATVASFMLNQIDRFEYIGKYVWLYS
jgi:putative NADH-flavin reductase